jgi:trans-aconitate methyltransferase
MGEQTEATRQDRWTGGDSYEEYVGRWSRGVAVEFVDWLDAAPGRSWLDLGCGTGALTTAILERADPAAVVGIDPSPSFIDHARAATPDRRAVFLTGDALALPLAAGSADVVVSGLVLNFIPDTSAALREFLRIARPGAMIAAYVWDYAEKMEPIRAFWDAAIALDPAARDLDEARRFPVCAPDELRALFADAGLVAVANRTIDVVARFASFDDYWTPFLSGTGPAPGYCVALPEDRREALRALLAERFPPAGDGSITMTARAFAVRATSAR